MCDCADTLSNCTHSLKCDSGGGPGTGTVTNIATVAPITGGPITSTGTIQVSTFDATHRGVVPASGGSSTDVLHADGAWGPAGGSFVTLQGSTPGTPDTGNFNVSGTGLIQNQLILGPAQTNANVFLNIASTGLAGGLPVVSVTDPSDQDAFRVFADGSCEIEARTISDTALVVNNYFDDTQAWGLTVGSTKGISAVFQSLDATNTQPTLVTQQTGASAVNILEGRLVDATPVLQFNPVGARLGLGNLPGLPDTMLHLFGGNTFTGSAAIIVQNDSQTNDSLVSKLCLSDSNSDASTSNATILLHTLNGSNGALEFYVNSPDNDTPGTLVQSFNPSTNVTSIFDPGGGGGYQTLEFDGANRQTVFNRNGSEKIILDESVYQTELYSNGYLTLKLWDTPSVGIVHGTNPPDASLHLGPDQDPTFILEGSGPSIFMYNSSTTAAIQGDGSFRVTVGTSDNHTAPTNGSLFTMAPDGTAAIGEDAGGDGATLSIFPPQSGMAGPTLKVGTGVGQTIAALTLADSGAAGVDMLAAAGDIYGVGAKLLIKNDGTIDTSSSVLSDTFAQHTVGGGLYVQVNAPAQTASPQGGNELNIVGADGVAGTNPGAAGGGTVNIQAGTAYRTTSGDADGGSIALYVGAGVGTGVAGSIQLVGNTVVTGTGYFSGLVTVATELDTVDLAATGVVNFSNLPTSAGASGTLYKDGVTGAVFVSP